MRAGKKLSLAEVSMSNENEFYEVWREAPEAEKWEWEELLFEEVRNHAMAAVWTRMAEFNPDLAQEIVCAVYGNLPRFRGECRFSTFVHAIARNKINEVLRNRIRWRKVFAENRRRLPAEEAEVGSEDQRERPCRCPIWIDLRATVANLDAPILQEQLRKGLSDDDGLLLECKCESMSSAEIGALLGIGVEAVDSRWARLRPKLRQRYLGRPTAAMAVGQLIN